MQRLSEFFHVVAPDYPGFGNSSRPDANTYPYTFANLANTIYDFTRKLHIAKFHLYTFDFGAPVGFTIASSHPESIAGIFSQSGNVYEEGLSPAFGTIKTFWASPQDPDALKYVNHIFTPEGIFGAYKHGVHHPQFVRPDEPSLDTYFTSRPGAADIQVALLYDYRNVVKSYPAWQKYLRGYQPKVVAVWGKNDPFFSASGAEAFKRDVPNADVRVIDAGHFAMQTNQSDILEGLKKLL